VTPARSVDQSTRPTVGISGLMLPLIWNEQLTCVLT
jgi:hypothetical protein